MMLDQHLFDHLITAVVTTDTAFKIEFANQAAHSLFSDDKSDLQGKDLFLFFSDDNLEPLKAKIIAGGVSGYNVRIKPGKQLMLAAAMYRTEKGVLRIQFNFVEQPARPAIHKQLHESMSKVFRTLAHDIKNPLNNIGLSVEQLITTAQNESNAPLLQIIARNTGRINTILNNLMAILRPPELVQSPMDINDFLKQFIAASQLDQKFSGINFSVAISEVPMIVAADEELLKQAMELILNNCADAQSATITIETFSSATFNHVRIADDGCGINPDDLEAIFQPYFSTKSKSGGMGLPTVLNIMNAHDAIVEITANPNGKGVVVLLSFKQPS